MNQTNNDQRRSHKAPKLDADTIKWLDNLYPEKSAREKDTIEQIWIYAGIRKVINKALTELERQESRSHLNRDPQMFG